MRYICWVLFLCLLLCGCPQEPVETATRPVSGQGGKKQVEQVAFVAYVEDTDDGGTQAVVYYPDEDRKRVIGTSALGEPPVVLQTLPHLRPPILWGEGRHAEQQAVYRVIYLDSVTGQVLLLDPSIDLEENPRKCLIDLVRERALVFEHEADSDPSRPTAKLYLFRGREATALGRIGVNSPQRAAAIKRYYSLSPNRRYVTWTGPEGSYWCDLETGKTRRLTSSRTRKIYEPLPDGSGFVCAWDLGNGTDRWELINARTGEVEATGEGRIFAISPDGVYWTIRNEDGDWNRDPAKFVQVIPGREPSTDVRVVEGAWAIEGTQVQLWTTWYELDAERSGLCRITLEGQERFALARSPNGQPRMLTLDHGGRMVLRTSRPHELAEVKKVGGWYGFPNVVLNFAGEETLSLGEGKVSLPLGDFVCVTQESDEGCQVKWVNFITGEAQVVLHSEAQLHIVYVTIKVGGSYVVWACHGEGADQRYDLYVGKAGGQEWKLVSRNIRQREWREWRPVN